MNVNLLIQKINNFVESNSANFISEKEALNPSVIGLRIFGEPVVAFGDALDSYFFQLKAPDVVGTHFKLPQEWLEDARTVISYFCPFTESVRNSNKKNFAYPSDEWMHGRIEGEVFLKSLGAHIVGLLKASGYDALLPGSDKRLSNDIDGNRYTSNWSERHVAYTCGLGTFSLSGGLITKKGVAGRFGSVVTNWRADEYTLRDYDGPYEHCSMCGLCVEHCPAGAISLESGKKHPPCSDFLDRVRADRTPYYGCGKCQIDVPCEDQIP